MAVGKKEALTTGNFHQTLLQGRKLRPTESSLQEQQSKDKKETKKAFCIKISLLVFHF